MFRIVLVAFFALAMGLSAQAKEISVTVDGKTYQCVGDGSVSGSYCDGKVEGLNVLVDACMEDYGGAYCMDNYWDDFVKENPGCKADAMPVCIDACKKDFGGAYCADKCSNA